jgi:hypothetical protein
MPAKTKKMPVRKFATEACALIAKAPYAFLGDDDIAKMQDLIRKEGRRPSSLYSVYEMLLEDRDVHVSADNFVKAEAVDRVARFIRRQMLAITG